jgi:LCP family protein required for cell wall assembly
MNRRPPVQAIDGAAGSLGRVADEKDPADPRYGWLYTERGDGTSGTGDADKTQLIRRDGPPSADPAPQPTTPTTGGPHDRDGAPGPTEATRAFRYEDPPGPATPDETQYQAQPGRPYGTDPAAPMPVARPRKRRRWWLRTILLLVLVWILFVVLVPIWAWTKVSKVNAEPAGSRPSATPGTTYLLVGSDSRRGLTSAQNKQLGTGGVSVDSGRTDTIMLMHVPAGGGPTLLLSIPRDSYVAIPGYGQNKINAAFSLGGPRLLVRTVENATGVRIDDYVEIGFSGFVRLVNAVGGITICPKQSINDPKADLNVRKGCQHADGKTALGYSRSRKFPLGDITRAEHQREVVNATAKKAAAWQTVVLPWRYWKVNFAGAESVRVGKNVGPIAMAKFAWAMAHSSNGKKCVVPYSSLGTATSAGSAVIWDPARAKQVFALIRADDTQAIRCAIK